MNGKTQPCRRSRPQATRLPSRRSGWIATLGLTLLLAGCATLEPVHLPEETTPPPADTALWASVSALDTDNWHILLDNGPEALDWRLTAIDSAAESIDLQTFLWLWDDVGTQVLRHVLAAADRGVFVRLLVDDSFLLGDDQRSLALDEHPNIEYRVYNPYRERPSRAAARELLNLNEFHRIDHRMHNKAMVIDNRVAIVGGRNLADEYFGLHEEANFRDLELLVGGPIAQEVAAEFDRYWNDGWSFPASRIERDNPSLKAVSALLSGAPETPGLHREHGPSGLRKHWLAAVEGALPGDPVLFADNPLSDDPEAPEGQPVQLAARLMDILDSAEEEILIISAYLIPTERLESAIARAVERGVSVRMLTNSIQSNNHLVAHSAYRNHIHSLMHSGAQLHEVKTDAQDRARHMLTPVSDKKLALHAKALVIDDDRVFIGSTNLDPRSLRINSEMGLLVRSPELNAALRQAVWPDFDQANAWSLQLTGDGKVQWVSGDLVLDAQPAASFMQSIEDWFLSHLPLEEEL